MATSRRPRLMAWFRRLKHSLIEPAKWLRPLAVLVVAAPLSACSNGSPQQADVSALAEVTFPGATQIEQAYFDESEASLLDGGLQCRQMLLRTYYELDEPTLLSHIMQWYQDKAEDEGWSIQHSDSLLYLPQMTATISVDDRNHVLEPYKIVPDNLDPSEFAGVGAPEVDEVATLYGLAYWISFPHGSACFEHINRTRN